MKRMKPRRETPGAFFVGGLAARALASGLCRSVRSVPGAENSWRIDTPLTDFA